MVTVARDDFGSVKADKWLRVSPLQYFEIALMTK